MTSSLFLLLIFGASLTVHGHFVETYETAEDASGVNVRFPANKEDHLDWGTLNKNVQQRSDRCLNQLPKLEGKTYHITSTETNLWWHTDVSKQSQITTRWSQGKKSDAYTEFSFVRMPFSANKFKIKRSSSPDFVYYGKSLFYTGVNNYRRADIFIILPVCNGYLLVREATNQFVYSDNHKNPNVGSKALYSNSVFKFEEK